MKKLVFVLLRGVSTDRRLLWRDGGSALHERLIVDWFGGRAPSVALALPLEVAPLVICLCGAIVDLEEAF